MLFNTDLWQTDRQTANTALAEQRRTGKNAVSYRLFQSSLIASSGLRAVLQLTIAMKNVWKCQRSKHGNIPIWITHNSRDVSPARTSVLLGQNAASAGLGLTRSGSIASTGEVCGVSRFWSGSKPQFQYMLKQRCNYGGFRHIHIGRSLANRRRRTRVRVHKNSIRFGLQIVIMAADIDPQVCGPKVRRNVLTECVIHPSRTSINTSGTARLSIYSFL